MNTKITKRTKNWQLWLQQQYWTSINMTMVYTTYKYDVHKQHIIRLIKCQFKINKCHKIGSFRQE